MPAIPHSLQVPSSEILVNLVAGLKAGDTVLTPNKRLAITLRREFDRTQGARGISAWASADILPISAFIERIYEDALYSAHAPHLPLLLTSVQEQFLWEDAVTQSVMAPVLLSVTETARLAREAWVLAHEWQLISQLGKFALNDDCKAFSAWSHHYENLTLEAHQIDRARLCTLVTGLCGCPGIAIPKRLVCYGFDSIPPQQAALLAKLEESGCEVVLADPFEGRSIMPHAASGNVRRVECDVNTDEIYHAAVWARARVEMDRAARVGIVVPRLSEYRNSLVRIFGSVMEPDVRQALPDVPQHMPFNISLGMALSSYPLVHAAFLVLELAHGEIEFERASLLLRSPFLAGGETEMLHRAQLDAKLRKYAEPVITLERLLVLVKRENSTSTNCPVLLKLLSACDKFCKTTMPSGKQRPSILARVISDILRLAGFPGERTLDSSEYQTLQKWQEILAGFALLDNVTKGMSYRQAISRLRRTAANTLFQPETPDVPIQILGVHEASGMIFDHLWVMGLSDEAWPPQPRPNPFLPIELQQAERLPLASPAATLELASRYTNAWLAASNEVILSHARQTGVGDARELAPSPLIAHIAVAEFALPNLLPDYVRHRDLIHQARQLERIKDDPVPVVTRRKAPCDAARGGVSVIKDQVACPFRALALHRLRAEGLKTPHFGLDAAERGTLIHETLAHVWGQIRNKSTLDATVEEEVETLLANAAGEAIARIRLKRPSTLSERFAWIEQRRLMKLAREWLDEERKRDDFTVVSTETRRNIEIAGLALSTRLDRVDELADGRRIVIDYKTRAPSASAMLGERPDEPQLPLYLVAAEPDAAAIAFAQVKTGEMRFTALARDSDLLPGVKAFAESRHADPYGSWETLVAAWLNVLVGVVTDFSSGHSPVDPKKYPHTCSTCDVRPLCRIYERATTCFIMQREEE